MPLGYSAENLDTLPCRKIACLCAGEAGPKGCRAEDSERHCCRPACRPAHLRCETCCSVVGDSRQWHAYLGSWVSTNIQETRDRL